MTFILLQTPQQDSNIFSLSGPFHGPGHPWPLAGSQCVSDVSGKACVLLASMKIPRGLQGSLKLVHVKNTLDTVFLGPPSCFFFFLRNLQRVKPVLSPGPKPITLCFKKNFLALSLKLKLPPGILLFCMFLPLLVVIPPFCPSSFTVTLRRAQRALAMPPFPPLSRTSVPKNQLLSLCPSEAKHSLIRIPP